MNEFTNKAIEIIRQIPKGKVATYGQIARLAGNPRSARRISRILHQYSIKFKLPWHRILNAKGEISLQAGAGLEEQKAMLEKEKVKFQKNRIDLNKYLWKI